MESFRRKFDWHLPTNSNEILGPETYKLKIKLTDVIISEINYQLLNMNNNELSVGIANLIKKINTSNSIIATGDERELIYRGAIEYLRLLPIFASKIAPEEIVQKIDELSQLQINCSFIPSEENSELTEKDCLMFEALGRFGKLNDIYNEEVLSLNYLPQMDLLDQVGDFRVFEVIDWVKS